jgi:hypothetical protein
MSDRATFMFSRARTFIAVSVLGIALAAASPAAAQRTDSVAQSLAVQPPITPRRAFFYSFLVPGYSQTVLGRHKAAAAFLLVEAISLTMIRESVADVHEAKRTENDTLIVSYVDGNGQPVVQTAPPRFTSQDVRTRRAHIEDWAALLVANHLFAGADGFVAANLWDLPSRIGLRVLPRDGGAVVSASFKW